MEDIVPGRTGRGQSTLRWVGTKQRYIGLKMHEVAKLAESRESFWLAVIRYFAKDLMPIENEEERGGGDYDNYDSGDANADYENGNKHAYIRY